MREEDHAIEICMATCEDIEELVNIRLEYLKVDFSVTKELEEKLRIQLPDYYTRHLGTDFHAYIAKADHKIISSVFLVIHDKPANPNYITGKIGNVLNVYTKKEFRRQGLAKQLMNIMIEDARRENLSYLELIATNDGYPVYQQLGFAEQKFSMTPMKLILN